MTESTLMPQEPSGLLRVPISGESTHRVRVKTQPFAVVLGDNESRILFVCASIFGDPSPGIGRIEISQVDVSSAGFP